MADDKPSIQSFGVGTSGGKFSGGFGGSYSVGVSLSLPGKSAAPAAAAALTAEQITQLFERAQSAHRAGQLTQAEHLYKQLLAADSRHAPALHLLGMLYYQQGQLAAAVERVRQAIAIKADARYLEHLGAIYVAAGQSPEAEQAYRQALQLEPAAAGAFYNLGVLYQQQQRQPEAETAYRQALAIDPADEDCLNNLVALLLTKGDCAAAELMAKQMIAARPDGWRGYSVLGDVLNRLARHADAEQALLQATRLDAHQAVPWVLLGCLYWDQQRWDLAAQAFEQAAHLDPQSADALVKLAGMRLQSEAPQLALEALQLALKREPQHVDAHILAADAHVRRGLFQQAEPWLHSAAQLARSRSLDGSAASGSADALSCLALFLLRQGRFEDGWALNELRYSPQRNAADAVRLPELPRQVPMWQGEPLAGKVILLISEQGHGDTIQFARYACLLKAQGASVWLWVTQPLFGLMQTLEGVDRLLLDSDSLPAEPLDYWVFPQSLPHWLGTRLDSIPAGTRYLRSDPAKAQFWRDWLAQSGNPGERRVGLVWSGNPQHANDKNRSIPFATLQPLLATPGVRFVSLQLGERANDAATYFADGTMLDPSARINDFSDSAALIEQLDLLISIDSAPVHLAGALGKPVWTLLPRVPDWRWLLDRDDSPWYTSVRLFRQPALQDWDSVVMQLQQALRQWLAE